MPNCNVEVTNKECHGNQEKMIRRFMKKVRKSGVLDEYRERMRFEKNSDKVRRKKRESIRNYKKEEAKRKKLQNA